MRILITNVYSWKNKGDAAIVLSLLDDVRRQFPNCHLAISSTDPDNLDRYQAQEHYKSVVAIFKNRFPINRSTFLGRLLYNIHHVSFRFRMNIFIALSKLGIHPYFLFSDEMAFKIRSYATFDLIIACGGGYLLQTSKLPKLDRWFRIHGSLLFAYDFYLAKTFNKPYILYNQSIGPFCRRTDFMAYIRFLKNANVVLCRESLTYQRLKDAGMCNIKQVADIAFHLVSKHSNLLSKYIKKNDGIKIGFTVRKWLDSNRQGFYENAIAEFIQNVLSQDGKAQFFFMPQVHYSGGDDDDSIVSQRIINKLPNQSSGSVHLIAEDLHPSELKHAIGQMDYFVGTRMHSNIFSLSMGIKTIAIAYEPKTIGIMKDLGLSQYVIPMENVSDENLLALFCDIQEDQNYMSILSNNLEQIKRLAICNLKLFAK